MRTLATIVILSCIFVGFRLFEGPSVAAVAVQQEAENVGFKWAFGAIVGPGKERKFVSVTRDTILNTGDEIKMCVELTKECYVYVVYAGSGGEIGLMFPYNLKQFDGDYKTGKNYYIPPGRKWSELDKNVGRETFYVLGSSERLIELEALLANYMSADNSRKQAIADQVLAEIRNVRKKFRTFTTLAEKPITIGGNVRSLEKAEEAKRPDVTTVAVRISANNFYSKTFTIDHK
ncbi:MAG: DUF4384 domain-containing protein [Ignavibacteriales bacterium]|nr:DUF4384 domain-containing protein [Ignavibacteriales bacterium]